MHRRLTTEITVTTIHSNCYRLLNTPVSLPLVNLHYNKNTHYDPLSCNFRKKQYITKTGLANANKIIA